MPFIDAVEACLVPLSAKPLARALLIAGMSSLLAACQTQESSFEGPEYSDETRQIEKELQAEAAALGTMQGAAGIATSFDRSGVGSLVAAGAGRAARDALMIKAQKRLEAQMKKDNAAFLARYGITEEEEPTTAVVARPHQRRRWR